MCARCCYHVQLTCSRCRRRRGRAGRHRQHAARAHRQLVARHGLRGDIARSHSHATVQTRVAPDSAAVAAQIYAKVEFANPGGSVKDRVAVRIIQARRLPSLRVRDGSCALTPDGVPSHSSSGGAGERRAAARGLGDGGHRRLHGHLPRHGGARVRCGTAKSARAHARSASALRTTLTRGWLPCCLCGRAALTRVVRRCCAALRFGAQAAAATWPCRTTLRRRRRPPSAPWARLCSACARCPSRTRSTL
jgi:hypothetical protein